MTLLLHSLLLAVLSVYSPQVAQPSKSDLVISISSLKDKEHNIYVAISRRCDGFPGHMDIAGRYILRPGGKDNINELVTDLPYGRYAVVIFQDINDNKKLDKNFIGIPTEPFAFSNNYHPLFGPPHWEDCEFEYSATCHIVNISKLIRI